MQYIARRELIFGLHIHVAVDDPEKAIQVVNGLLPQLAPLLALSASSPFWRGEATGLASSRQMVFAAFPRSGPPPRFRNYQDYAEVIGQLEKTGCIADYTHIWWDIRLHPRYGTVEIRICDGVTRVEDAVALTAYCQSLVKLLSEQHDAGEEIPSLPPDPHDREQVARRPLRARGADHGPHHRPPEPDPGGAARAADAARDRAARARARLRARARGDPGDPRRGNGSDRQLRVFNANRDIVEVASEIAAATVAGATGRSRPRPRNAPPSAPASYRSRRRTRPGARRRGARGRADPILRRSRGRRRGPTSGTGHGRGRESGRARAGCARGEVQRRAVARDRGRGASPRGRSRICGGRKRVTRVTARRARSSSATAPSAGLAANSVVASGESFSE